MMVADKFGIYGVSIWKIALAVMMVGIIAIPTAVEYPWYQSHDSMPTEIIRTQKSVNENKPMSAPPIYLTETATYSSSLGAPECTSGSSPCTVPQSLVQCNDNQASPGPEPNQPNTIGLLVDSTTSGTCHSDESVENFDVTVADGQFSPGDSISVSATFYMYDTTDYWGICYDDNVDNGESWTLKASGQELTGAGYRTYSTSFVLGSTAGRHGVRVIVKYNAAVTVCSDSTTSYRDTDDLAFAVVTTNQKPAIPALSTPWDFQKGGPWTSTLRPQFNFSTTDPEGNTINYNIQVSTDPNFGSTVINAVSGVDTGFSGTPPYASGAMVTFTAQSDLTSGTTYWWKVRATDPGGSTTWSSFSSSRSVTIQSGQTDQSWFQTTKEQFDRDMKTSTITTTSGGGAVELPTSISYGDSSYPGGVTWSAGYTDVTNTFVIGTTGTISSWSVYKVGTGDLVSRLKIFRDDSINLNFVGNSNFETASGAAGVYTFSTSVSVQSGDLIGIAATSGTSGAVVCSCTTYDKAGDVSTNSAKTTWTTESYRIAVSVVVGVSASSGSVTSGSINYTDGPSSRSSWGSITWNKDITYGSVTVAVQKYTTSWVWATSSYTTSPINIAPLATQSQIRLVANLTYSGGTPKLLDWEVSWIASVVPQVLSLDVRHAGSSIGDGGKLYAGLTEEFVVEARDPQGQTDIQYVDLRLDGTTDYIARWTEGGTFTKQAGGSYFDIDLSSSATYASNKWTITYKLKFAWGLPWADTLVDPVVYVIDDESNTAIKTFDTKTYMIENDLIFSGTLIATGQYQGALSSGSWVRGGESITWTGLTVYYEASTVFPLDSDFDVRIRDNDGTTWTQTTGSALNLVTIADSTNKTSDIHTIDIINVPGGGPHGSMTYEIKIDNEKPAKPLIVTANPSGWTSTNSFSVDWTNPADLSGIVTGARYKLDSPPTSDTDGTWVATKPITSLSVSGDGSHTIYVWLKDAVGNVNYLNYNSTNLFLDGSGAVFSGYSVWNGSAWVSVSGWIRSQTPNVCIQVQVMYSGIDKPNTKYYHSENGGSIWSSALSVTGVGTACGLNDAADGTTATVYVTINDVPFNQDSDMQNQIKFDVLSKSNAVRQSTAATIKVDSIAPGVPAGLTATPPGWINVNSFSVNWNNPADLSGIVGGYYKLSAPTGNGDGTWSTSKPISGVTVPGEGTYTLYLYLKDNAGNTNYLSTSTVSLYYDATAPDAPTGVTADGSSPSPWKNVSSFSIDWTPPVGDLSGIAGGYYKMYSPPSTPTDGTYSTSKPFIAAPPTDGPLTLYLWMKDNAGNADHTKRGTVTIRYDGTPPTTISDLSSPKATGTTIKLAWSIPTEPNFLKYEIYYATHSGITLSDKKWDDSNDSGLSSLTGNTTTITGLSPSSTYYFRIRAIDLATNKAVLSNEITISTGIQQTKWHLYNGANFVAVTCNPPSWTAYTLGKSITQNITPGKAYEIMRWNANIQSWESVISTNGIDWYGTDFPVIRGGGYVVRVSGVASGGIDYTFSGTEILNPVNLVLHKDSVLIGIPFSNTTYKACLLLQRIKEQNNIPITDSVEVQWWNPLKGSYVGSTYTYFFGEWTCTLTDDNFIIEPEHGYFIRITQGGIFNP